MANSPGRGALILIEGVDRAGKSTQCQLLVEYLSSKGIPVDYVRFPDRTTPIGQIIDGHLRSKLNIEDHAALHLLYSANRWEVAEAMKNALGAGTSIVMDRYAFSGASYSIARGLSVEWCKSPDRGLPAPDVVILLDASAGVQASRGEWGEERYDKPEFQAKVAAAFDVLRRGDETWVQVDGSGDPAKIHLVIKKIADETLEKAQKNRPLRSLWVE